MFRFACVAATLVFLLVSTVFSAPTPVVGAGLDYQQEGPANPPGRPAPERPALAEEAPPIPSPAGPDTLSGVLSVVWPDTLAEITGQISAPAAAEPVFTLFTDAGEAIRLEAPAALTQELAGLAGRRITVQGRRAPQSMLTAGGGAAFRVFQIAPSALLEEPGITSVTGSQPWVSVLCKFSDIAAEPKAPSYFTDMYMNAYPGLDHYWREASYNMIDLVGSYALPAWVILPYPRSHYVTDSGADLGALAADCTAAADVQIYYPNFVGINLMFNDNLDCCAWGGGWTMTLDGQTKFYRMTWEPPWGYGNIAVLAHETGHGFGMPHSSGEYGYVYDNRWDVMSDLWSNPTHPIFGTLPQHPIAFQKSSAITDWIPAGQVVDVLPNADQTVTLERLAQPTTGNARLVRVQRGSSLNNYYTVEARRWAGYDANLPGEGVIIHRIEPGVDPRVIDVDGNGNTGDDGAIWLPGETFTDAAYGITITITAATATGYTVSIHNPAPPIFTGCASQTSVSEAECNALVDLYNATNGPGWVNSAGWLADSNVCGWYGVYCGAGHVDGLDLDENNLVGPLPASIGNLSWLSSLSLYNNQLSGSIPAEIGNLASLGYLALNMNQLSGSIPPEVGGLSSVWYFNLGTNQLSGSIPTTVGNMTGLEYFYVYNNDLTGPIPPQLANATGLGFLALNGNQLTGAIPVEIGSLTNLRWIGLSSNQLTGSIPAQLGNLPLLYYLSLGSNQLSGAIPAEIGNLTALVWLYLHYNQLSGAIPAEIGNLTVLQELNLYDNQLSGPIPPQLGNLSALQYLDLGWNRFSGTIPLQLGNLTSLTTLYLDANALAGPIPVEFTQLVNLNTLLVYANALFSNDPAVIAFMDAKSPGWAASQTTPPTGVSAVPSGGDVQINWQAIAYTQAGGYEVYYATNPAGPFSKHGEVGDKLITTYLAGGLSANVQYYFYVQAFTNPHGGNPNRVVSAPSAVVTVPRPAAFGKTAPANSATNQSYTSLTLTWQAASPVTRYAVCVAANSYTCAWTDVGSVTSYTATNLIPNMRYNWQVRAYNGETVYTSANGGTWWSFTTRQAPPAAFGKTAPVNSATDQSYTSLTLSWQATSPVTRYAVCVAANSYTCAWTDVGSATSYTATNLTPNTRYNWQVRAYNGETVYTSANSGSWWSFTTRPVPPAAFNKLSPANGATNQSYTSLTLTWQATSPVTRYAVCVAANSYTCTWTDVGSATSYTATNLIPNTRYNWQVRAYNGEVVYTSANGGSWWSFTTRQGPPVAFGKTVPANGATNQSYTSLTLTWQATAPVTYYQICVAANSYTCTTWQNVGTNTSYTVTNLTPNTRYNWQVRAYNGTLMTSANGGAWWSFTTRPVPPAAFNKLSPANGATNRSYTSLTLTWQATSPVTRYEVCVAANSYTCTTWKNVGTNTSYTVTNLTPNMRYNWQVRAYNGEVVYTSANSGSWWSFYTIP